MFTSSSNHSSLSVCPSYFSWLLANFSRSKHLPSFVNGFVKKSLKNQSRISLKNQSEKYFISTKFYHDIHQKKKTGNYIWLNVYVSPYDAAFRKLTTATVIMGNIILYGGYKFSFFFLPTQKEKLKLAIKVWGLGSLRKL